MRADPVGSEREGNRTGQRAPLNTLTASDLNWITRMPIFLKSVLKDQTGSLIALHVTRQPAFMRFAEGGEGDGIFRQIIKDDRITAKLSDIPC